MVQMIVSGQSATAAQLFNYDPPSVSTISPATSPTSGGNILTISGLNFGSTGITFTGGRICNATAPGGLYRDDRIQCSVPQGLGATNPLVVLVASGQQNSTSVNMPYQVPVITQLVPSVGPTGGSIPVTIVGSNFGCISGPIPQISVSFDSSPVTVLACKPHISHLHSARRAIIIAQFENDRDCTRPVEWH